MQYCSKCKIFIQGKKSCCPLCQGKVIEKSTENLPIEKIDVFPPLKNRVVSWMSFVRLITFLMAACEIVFAMISVITHFHYAWMMFTMLAVFVTWTDILIARYVHSNLLKLISVETIIACLILLFIDLVTGFRGWSVCWVIPIVLPVLTFATVLIAKIQRFKLTEYVMYLFLDFICAILLISFLAKGSFHFELLADIIITAYLVLAAAVVIFGFRSFRAAASRRFKM